MCKAATICLWTAYQCAQTLSHSAQPLVQRCHLFGGRCEEKREEDGRVCQLGNFWNRFQNLDFSGFSCNVQFQNFGFFCGFPRFLGDPKNSQNADFSAVSRDFEGRARPKILCSFPAMNRAQNLDLPAVSRNF